MARRCRGNKLSRCSSSSSSDSSKEGCRSHCLTSVSTGRAASHPASHTAGSWLAGSTQDPPNLPHQQRCVDALLRENIFLAILSFLEVTDAARLASCCSELQAALRAPRVEPLWRLWFERSGFVSWPYGGVCGASCLLEIDRDGFVLQNQQQQQQHKTRNNTQQLPAGYKQFRHEGWCCQFLWNARAWDNWKRGCCASFSLPTDSHKIFMVSVHPKGLYASRAATTTLPPCASLQQRAVETVQGAALLEPQQQQQQQQQQQMCSQVLSTASQVHQGGEPVAEPFVQFIRGAGQCQLHALKEKSAVLTATSDRVLCILEPLAGASFSSRKIPRGCLHPFSRSLSSPGSADGGGRAPKDACASPSPRTSYASMGNLSSLENLELELESLISGGSSRRGSGKGRRSGGFRPAAAGGGPGDTRRSSCDGPPGTPRITAKKTLRAAATAAAAAPEVREICRCGPRTSWLGCSIDAASGLMACCMASNELSSNGRRRRKKGAPGAGVADACEYRVFDLLAESEVTQLAIDGHLVHSLLLNFVFSQDARRVFAFDRWHREFFMWDLNGAICGKPVEAAAIVNAHTDGILALDTTDAGGSCRVLCGSRDETVSLYSVDPVVRLATFHGHEAEVSAICWLRNGDGWQAPAAEAPFGGAAGAEVQIFASGAYDGQIKILDSRQDEGKGLASMGLTLLEHQNRITRLASAWDGRMLVSSDVDGVVKAWDLRNCTDSLMTAQYNGAILDLQANRAFCIVRASPPRGRDSVHVLNFSEGVR